MPILVIADHDNQTIRGATLNTIAAAAKIGGDIVVLVAGGGCAAAGDGRGDGVQGGGFEGAVVVFGNHEGCHVGFSLDLLLFQMTLASLRSFSTSALASATLTPALRVGGSSTFSVARRGLTSTPSASGLSVSSGFFFAFMMLGKVT